MTPICRVHRRRRLFTLTFCGMPFSGIEPRRQRPNSRPQPRRERSRGERERETEREREREQVAAAVGAIELSIFSKASAAAAAILRTNERWLLAHSLPSELARSSNAKYVKSRNFYREK